MTLYMGLLYIIYHFLVRNIGCEIDKAILDPLQLYELVDDRVNCTFVHIRYFNGYVYHICLQDTIQSTLSLCLPCQAMLLPMPPRPLLLTRRSTFMVAEAKMFRLCWGLGMADSDRSAKSCTKSKSKSVPWEG